MLKTFEIIKLLIFQSLFYAKRKTFAEKVEIKHDAFSQYDDWRDHPVCPS